MVSDLNKNFGGSTDLAKKRHGSADLHTLFTPSLRENEFTALSRPPTKQLDYDLEISITTRNLERE